MFQFQCILDLWKEEFAEVSFRTILPHSAMPLLTFPSLIGVENSLLLLNSNKIAKQQSIVGVRASTPVVSSNSDMKSTAVCHETACIVLF